MRIFAKDLVLRVLYEHRLVRIQYIYRGGGPEYTYRTLA